MVIIPNFTLSDIKSLFGSNTVYQFIQPVADFDCQYFSPGFNAPYNMVIDVVCSMITVMRLIRRAVNVGVWKQEEIRWTLRLSKSARQRISL